MNTNRWIFEAECVHISTGWEWALRFKWPGNRRWITVGGGIEETQAKAERAIAEAMCISEKAERLSEAL